MKQRTLFISHAEEDDAVADLITDELKNRGIETWIDHQNLRSGQFWPDEIQKSLDTCEAGILILTNHSQSSKECYFEWSYLLGRPVKLHLVIYNEHELETFPYRLHTCQRINLDKGLDEGIALLAQSVSMDIFPMDAATPIQIKEGLVDHMVTLEFQIVKVVKVVLDMAIETFRSGVNTFLRKLGNFLNLSRQDLELLNIKPGSVILEIQMPGFAADVLEREMKVGKAKFLEDFHFISVNVIQIMHDNSKKGSAMAVPNVSGQSSFVIPEPPILLNIGLHSPLHETNPFVEKPSDINPLSIWQILQAQASLISFTSIIARAFTRNESGAPTFGQMANLFRDLKNNNPQNQEELNQLVIRYPFLKQVMKK